MIRSSHTPGRVTLLTMFLCGYALGDVVEMNSPGAHLSGTVRSMDEAGTVELTTNLSPEPLRIPGNSIDSIRFGENAGANLPASTMVRLVNGDRLPVTIESMDKQTLTALSPDAGRVLIPRTCVESMQFFSQPAKTLYKGPREAREWQSPDANRSWIFDENSLSTHAAAFAFRKFDLPEQFVFRFSLKWDPKTQPNFKISFADPILDTGTAADRYFLQFNSAGLEIKRESSTGKRYNSLHVNPQTPDQFAGQELRISLRVDRKSRQLHLSLNEAREITISDPVEKAPTGSGISFEGNAAKDATIRIQNIEIEQNNLPGNRLDKTIQADRKTDWLVSQDGEKWSGEITEIRKTDTGSLFLLSSDTQKTPLALPGSKIAAVYFKKPEAAGDGEKPSSITLRLKGDGRLSSTSCTLGATSASLNHPLLGKLEIQRTGITHLEKSAPGDIPTNE